MEFGRVQRGRAPVIPDDGSAAAVMSQNMGLRRRRLSKSATKARIELERQRRIVDIPRFHPRLIPVRGAFVADFDTIPSQTAPGAPSVSP